MREGALKVKDVRLVVYGGGASDRYGGQTPGYVRFKGSTDDDVDHRPRQDTAISLQREVSVKDRFAIERPECVQGRVNVQRANDAFALFLRRIAWPS